MTFPKIRLLMDDTSYELDLNRLMLTETIALEDDWGLSVEAFQAAATSGSPPYRVIGAMVWLAKVRSAAAAQGVTFPEAARQFPVATFDVDLMAMQVEADAPEPPNPTGSGTRTRATRTTRATSGRKPARGASPSSAASGPERSPST